MEFPWAFSMPYEDGAEGILAPIDFERYAEEPGVLCAGIARGVDVGLPACVPALGPIDGLISIECTGTALK